MYDSPPKGETKYDFAGSRGYLREIRRCGICGHFVSVHAMGRNVAYTQQYVDSTYGEKGVLPAFERIISLPASRSDNEGRVSRILSFAEKYLQDPAKERRPPRLLDVGSGLGVFPFRMKQSGWECTALDPDPRAAEHARCVVGVNAVCDDFLEARLNRHFDVITFNKVLEHVEHPVTMLATASKYLLHRGFVYIELPDGEVAVDEGQERQEFFIEHHHVFSFASTAMLATRSGYTVLAMERLQEPSRKYTIRAFLSPLAHKSVKTCPQELAAKG